MKFFSFFQMIGAKIVRAVSWIFGMAKSTTGLSPQTYLVLQFVVVLLITAVLAFFSTALIPPANIPYPNPIIKQYYLGILFFLFYVFARLLVYVIGLFRVQESSGFPDIDRAWEAGMEAMADADLDPQWLPLFLVVGVTHKQERNLFAGARFTWSMQAPGPDERSPLRFYAFDDALFITCPGVSAAARHLESSLGTAPAMAVEAESEADDGVTRTLKRQDILQAMQEQPAAVGAAAGGGASEAMHTLLPGQRPTLAPPGGGPAAAQPQRPASRNEPALSAEELQTCRRRLDYLCGLISEARAPFCPINGLLLVAPLDRSDAQSLKQDAQAIRDNFQMSFPIVFTFSGMEELHGFTEFTERGCKLDKRFRDSRAGSRFPIGHPVDEAAAKWVIDKGFEWFRGWIYSAFAEDIASPANTKLYRLLGDFEERRARLEFLLRQTLGDGKDVDSVRLTGCYFCATGSGAKRQAFIHGVLQKLINEQEHVAWSEDRLKGDSRRRGLAQAVMAAIAVLVAVDGYLLWQIWRR